MVVRAVDISSAQSITQMSTETLCTVVFLKFSFECVAGTQSEIFNATFWAGRMGEKESMKGKLFLRLGILLQNLFLNLPPQTVMLCKPFSNRSLMFQPADFTADPRRLKCLEESSEGTFHRQHDIGRKLEFPYTHKQASNLRSDIN